MTPDPKTDNDPIKVVREGGEVGQYADAVSCTWTGFLNGRWTKDEPTRPGKYLVADRQGVQCGEIVFYLDQASGKIRSTNKWGGWFWSRPMPPTPVSAPRDWPEETPVLQLVKND